MNPILKLDQAAADRAVVAGELDAYLFVGICGNQWSERNGYLVVRLHVAHHLDIAALQTAPIVCEDTISSRIVLKQDIRDGRFYRVAGAKIADPSVGIGIAGRAVRKGAFVVAGDASAVAMIVGGLDIARVAGQE